MHHCKGSGRCHWEMYPRRQRILESTCSIPRFQNIISRIFAPFSCVRIISYTCHSRSNFRAGWIFCPYVRKSIGPVTQVVLQINTKMGGTSRFTRHVRTRENPDSSNSEHHSTLSVRCLIILQGNLCRQ